MNERNECHYTVSTNFVPMTCKTAAFSATTPKMVFQTEQVNVD